MQYENTSREEAQPDSAGSIPALGTKETKMRDLIVWPNPILRQPVNLVTEFDENLQNLVDDMFRIMETYKGAGLAAPQVGERKSVVIYNCDGEKGTLINPVLTPIEDAKVEEFGEGCLSFPGVYVNIARPNIFKLQWQDVTGKFEEDEFYGFVALAIQHELDHLQGKTLVNYLPGVKRDFVTRKMMKIQKRKKLYQRQLKKLGKK